MSTFSDFLDLDVYVPTYGDYMITGLWDEYYDYQRGDAPSPACVPSQVFGSVKQPLAPVEYALPARAAPAPAAPPASAVSRMVHVAPAMEQPPAKRVRVKELSEHDESSPETSPVHEQPRSMTKPDDSALGDIVHTVPAIDESDDESDDDADDCGLPTSFILDDDDDETGMAHPEPAVSILEQPEFPIVSKDTYYRMGEQGKTTSALQYLLRVKNMTGRVSTSAFFEGEPRIRFPVTPMKKTGAEKNDDTLLRVCVVPDGTGVMLKRLVLEVCDEHGSILGTAKTDKTFVFSHYKQKAHGTFILFGAWRLFESRAADEVPWSVVLNFVISATNIWRNLRGKVTRADVVDIKNRVIEPSKKTIGKADYFRFAFNFMSECFPSK